MSAQKRQKVFIGSSKEQISFARAVQESLYSDFDIKVWDQQVYELSEYPLESLFRELEGADFGIFILAPDDLILSREDKHLIPRDNVIFELGMFTGKLGRGRTFILTPIGSEDLHLPTDLLGLTLANYDPSKINNEIIPALGPACNKIRRLINNSPQCSPGKMRGVSRIANFTDFNDTFHILINNCTNITLYFIHSRRWRENYNDEIRSFLSQENHGLSVFLPDLGNIAFIKCLQSHFDDGKFIPGFIADAYRYFRFLDTSYPGSVLVRLYNTYPTYSFYKFDDTVIVAMYPTTPIHMAVPTFEVDINNEFGNFISKDIDQLDINCRTPKDEEILAFITKYSKP